MKRFVSAIFLTCACATAVYAADERILIGAKINGKSVLLAFDTGTSIPLVLYSTTARKLGLKVTPPSADDQIGPGQTPLGWTGLQKLDVGFTNVETCLGVIEIPAYLKSPEDGMLGWPALSNNIFSLDCSSHTITILTNAPEQFAGWIQCRIQTNSEILALELPSYKDSKGITVLDTGSPVGVELNPQKWHEWKTTHANQAATVHAYYTLNPGLVVAEETWAKEISLETLTLNDVPVMQADSASIALHSSPEAQFEATLGFAALKRLDIIIDGKHGVAYLRPKDTPPLPYEHNRLGAVFVPQDLQSDNLLAHVVSGSPASEAGISDGDVLLKIGSLDCTKWRTNPKVLPLSRFFERPAGSKLKLTLKRGDRVFKATAVLRNILPPDSIKNSN